jgi:tetratricopeptide (TPR) repeat protein
MSQGSKNAREHKRLRPTLICMVAVMAVSLCADLLASGCSGPMDRALELEKSGDPEGAIAAYQQVLAEDPANVVALSRAAVCLLALGRYDEALVLEERVVALDPTDALTRVELGFNYLNHQGRPDDAVEMLGEAAALDPSAKNLTFLAQAQAASDDYAGAESTLHQAMEADPEYGYSYGQLVRLLEEQGHGDEADEVREQALARGIPLADLE